jgi:phosphoribosyl-ATP pyrophosphohydrolase/phosphoribosyl-AMP cyclohydrolase
MRDRNAQLSEGDIAALAWDKMGGLLPAAVQDAGSGRLLMLGYMDQAALGATLRSGLATFYSRSKARLWQKGETSGNRLHVLAVHADCDSDALLVSAHPEGPTCHLGTASCFGGEGAEGPGWLSQLAQIVHSRATSGDGASYTRRLLDEGPARIAQKIGEEGVEVALAAVTRDAAGCAQEAADLLYHLTVLMESKGFGWEEVIGVLKLRHEAGQSAPDINETDSS